MESLQSVDHASFIPLTPPSRSCHWLSLSFFLNSIVVFRGKSLDQDFFGTFTVNWGLVARCRERRPWFVRRRLQRLQPEKVKSQNRSSRRSKEVLHRHLRQLLQSVFNRLWHQLQRFNRMFSLTISLLWSYIYWLTYLLESVVSFVTSRWLRF